MPLQPVIVEVTQFSSADVTFLVTLAELAYQNGDILYYNSGQLQRLAKSTDGKVLTLSSGLPSWAAASGGTGTVTSVSVTTANGVSGSVATATTTPAITLTLGAITPTSVNGITLSGSGSVANSGTTSLTGFTGSGTTSGTNTGDQTNISGTAAGLSATLVPASGGTGVANNNSATVTSSGNYAYTRTLSGATNMTFPAVTDTVAVLGTAQTYTATQTEKQVVWSNNAITASGNAATVPITSRLNTVTNNSAATLTITMTTTSAVDGQLSMVRILDFSAVTQTLAFVNTENSTVTAPVLTNGSTTLPLTVGFQYNALTSKWRCIAAA